MHVTFDSQDFEELRMHECSPDARQSCMPMSGSLSK